MPICGRLEKASLTEMEGRSLRFDALPHSSAKTPVDFAAVLRRFLPLWQIAESPDGGIGGRAPSDWNSDVEDEAETVLYLLETSVTIEDSADASHALRVHRLRDEDTDEWVYSDIGKLVREAKSYDQLRSPGDRRVARRLADEMLYWIDEMPQYRDADMIVPAPATNPHKEYDLPAFIAERLTSRLFMPVGRIRSTHTTPQKDLLDEEKASADELARQYELLSDVDGKVVLVIDDIYYSGATVGGVTKILRDGGASAVFSLTATKAAKGCQGLPPHTTNWPLEI